ncbi:MAG: hypothetical protein V1803_00820 [Candidatus Roizmanbacteria bacterium]
MKKVFVILLFITLCSLFFIFGINYQRIINSKKTPTPTPIENVSCTLEAKICPDGSSVGRVPPDCEFAPCPETTQPSGEKIFCGGFAGVECPEGYECQLEGSYPDAGGTCVKN